jgi:ADP-ribosylglycohydrolase
MSEIFGCVIGAAYADALGKATEFMELFQIKKRYGSDPKFVLGKIHMDEHRNAWDPFDWTDDTDQSVLIFQSIKESPENAHMLFAQKLYHWMFNGFPELGDTTGCGIGVPVRWVVTYPNFVSNPFEASHMVWKSTDGVLCEDGAIMRSWIIGCFDFDTDTLIRLSTSLCQVTHYDPRCVASCIFITLCVNRFLYHSKNISEVISEARLAGEKFIMNADYLDDSTLDYSRQKYVDKFNKYLMRGDCDSLDNINLRKPWSRSSTKNPLACAVFSMRNIERGYDNIIQHIVSQGGDADTNACVAGAVMGAYLGITSIPEDYKNLKFVEWLRNFF